MSHCPIVCFFFLFFFSAKDPSECHSLFLPPPPPLFFMWELSHSRQTSKKIPIALHLSQVPLLFKGLGNSDPLFQQLSLCNILLELHASYFSLVIQPNFHWDQWKDIYSFLSLVLIGHLFKKEKKTLELNFVQTFFWNVWMEWNACILFR